MSVLLAGLHIQSMPTGVEDVLELSPPARRLLADMEVRRHGCISIRGPQLEKDPSPHVQCALTTHLDGLHLDS